MVGVLGFWIAGIKEKDSGLHLHCIGMAVARRSLIMGPQFWNCIFGLFEFFNA
jgi:hypothetical protein